MSDTSPKKARKGFKSRGRMNWHRRGPSNNLVDRIARENRKALDERRRDDVVVLRYPTAHSETVDMGYRTDTAYAR